MEIRTYKPSDQAAVLRLFDLNTPQYFDQAERAGLSYYLQNELEDYFVVEEEGEIIGTGGINYEPQAKTAVLSWDIVKPMQHGKGIGSSLTQYRIAYINRKDEIDRISVRTSQHTHRFYEKMGFKLLNVVKNYWADGFDLYDMVQPNKRA